MVLSLLRTWSHIIWLRGYTGAFTKPHNLQGLDRMMQAFFKVGMQHNTACNMFSIVKQCRLSTTEIMYDAAAAQHLG
jgi:hypothetical protein